MKRIIASLLVSASVVAAAFAQYAEGDRPDARTIPLGDARALGLEQAMTAVNDDMNTLFYNPAGLAFLRRNYFNVDLGAGSSMFDQSAGSESYQRSHIGSHASMGLFEDDFYYTSNPVQIDVVAGGKGWGLALVDDYLAYVRNHDETESASGAMLPLRVSRRLGAAGGLGFNLGPVALGANLKCLTYSDYDLAFNANLEANDFTALGAQFLIGNGIDANTSWETNVGLGALVTLGMLNVGAYYDNMAPFIDAIAKGEEYSAEAYFLDCFKTMSVGVSFMPSNDKFAKDKLPIDLLMSLDLKNLGDNADRRLCAGVEFGFDLWNFVVATTRLGYNQDLPTSSFSVEEMVAAFSPANGEVSAGATVKLAILKASLAILAPVEYISGKLAGTPYSWQEIKGRATVSLCL